MIIGASCTAINKDAPTPRKVCHYCQKYEKRGFELMKCSVCKIAFYCCKDHQKLDYPNHKMNCKLIALHRKNMETYERNLKTNPLIINAYGDIFAHHEGHFGDIEVAHDYLQSRLSYILSLSIPWNGHFGYHIAINEMWDCIRLCRGKNIGHRNMLIFYLVAVDRDQEGYDITKWYETVPVSQNYDWSNLDLPFLNIRFYDMFESTLPYVLSKEGCNHSKTCMLFIKIRMMHQLLIRHKFISFISAAHSPHSPVSSLRGYNSIFRMIYEYLPNSHSIPKTDFFLLNHGGISASISKIRKQVNEHLHSIKASNKIILQAIANPTPLMSQKAPCNSYEPGSTSEAYIIILNATYVLRQNPYIVHVIETFLDGDIYYDPTLSFDS